MILKIFVSMQNENIYVHGQFYIFVNGLPLFICLPPAEFMTVMKRMTELEQKMTNINHTPVLMPPEKEEMLNNTISRADLLEKQLMDTKKVFNLFRTAYLIIPKKTNK